MEVLMLSLEYPPFVSGGLGEHVQKLVPALLEDPDLVVHVVAPDFEGAGGREVDGRLTVHRAAATRPEPGTGYFTAVEEANRRLAVAAAAVIAETGSIDLIHAHDWLVASAALSVGAERDVPLVSTIHATERGRLGGHIHSDLQRAIDAAEGRLARASDRVIVCSTAMCEEVQDFFGVPADRVRMIPNAVDAGRFDRIGSQDLGPTRARYALPEDQIIFFIGRLVYEKGADLLVEAAPAILRQVPQARIIIGGKGPLLAGLRERTAALGVADRVLLPGFVSDEDRDRLFVLADCCVFPSRYEPFGIVALESMAAGTPVVATNANGLGTIVIHNETGISVFTNSVDSLVWGVVTTLQDPVAAGRRADRAMQVVREGFSWPTVALQTIGVYRELVG